jgi:hypothetical protein
MHRLKSFFYRSGGAEMVVPGPSGVPSRPGVRLGDDVKRLKRLKIEVHSANAYRRRVAAKGAAGGARPMARPPRAASDRGSSGGCEPAASERGSSGRR